VTSRTLKSTNEHDASSDLLRRCRHAAASVGSQIYIYGGLRGDILLDDFLIAENAPFQSETDRVPRSENQNRNPNFNSDSPSFQQYTNNSHETAPGFRFLTHLL
jgi:protein phosphatase